jgi:hypothetical protein
VWVIDATGGPLTKISDHEEGDNSHPKIWLAPASGGAPSRLAADGLDLIPLQMRWAEGGKAMYFETGVRGTSQLYRVGLAARRASLVTSGDRTYRFVDLSDKALESALWREEQHFQLHRWIRTPYLKPGRLVRRCLRTQS